jgi:hypothetical protein
MYALRQSALYELNGVGYLLRKGVIDRDTAYSLTGGITALWIWRKFEPIIKEQRILYKTPEFYIELEYLAMEMVRELEERGFPRRPLRSMHVIQVGFLHSLILSLTRYTTAYTNGNSAFTGIKNRVNC